MKKHRKLQLIFTTLILAIVLSKSMNSQKCGSHTTNLTPIYNSINPNRPYKIIDRYGNEFNRTLKNPNDTSTVISLPSNPNGFPNVMGNLGFQSTCDAGIFRLYFNEGPLTDRFKLAANRDVVCKVFEDLSLLLQHSTPNNYNRIKIYVLSDDRYIGTFGDTFNSSLLSLGSSMYVIHDSIKNSVLEGEVSKTLKSGVNSFQNLPYAPFLGVPNSFYYWAPNYIHGYLVVNFTNFNINNDSRTPSIPSNNHDLYSIVLHEALHMLGMNSFISQNGDSKILEGLYTNYDRKLKKGSTNLITYNTSNNKWEYTGGLSNQANGCNNSASNTIQFNGTNIGNQAVFTFPPFIDGQSLHHFTCLGDTCSNYAAPSNTYVSTYCRDAGSGFIKRKPHDNEVKFLCDMGYSLRSKLGVTAYGTDTSNHSAYQTYSTCSGGLNVVGKNDLFSTYYQTPIKISKSQIISNDNNTTKLKINHTKLLTANAGNVSLITTAGNVDTIIYTPDSNFFGEAMIGYVPQNSANSDGSMTYITINVERPYNPICTEDLTCNLICNGDFENTAIDPFYMNWAIKKNKYSFPAFALYENNSSTLVPSYLSCYPYGNCYIPGNIGLLNNQISVSPKGGKRFVGMTTQDESYYNPPQPIGNKDEPDDAMLFNMLSVRYLDGMTFFKLKEKLIVGRTYQFKILASRATPDWKMTPMQLFVYGSISKPCINNVGLRAIMSTKLDGSKSICGYQAIRVDNNGVQIIDTVWKEYSFQFTATDTIGFITLHTDLIGGSYGTMPTPPIGYPTQPSFFGSIYIDNVAIYDNTYQKIAIKGSQTKNEFCIGTNHVIDYNVKLDSTDTIKNNLPIILQVTIPTGFKIDTSSSFDSTGKYTIASNTISGKVSIELKLKIIPDTTIKPDTMYQIGIRPLGNFCSADSSQVIIKVTARDFPLTMDKTTDLSFGNNFSFQFNICNKKSYPITNALIIDTVPSSISISNPNGFSQNLQVMTRAFSIGAKPINADSCRNYSFYTQTNSCKETENCFTVKIPNHICNDRYKSCVKINKDSGYEVALIGIDTICTNSGIRLKANVTPSSATYTYKWYHNNTLISGQNTDSLILINGLAGKYDVEVMNSQGCKTLISKTILNYPSVNINYSAINKSCQTGGSLGAINIDVISGLPPFTYLWNNGDTTKNRSNLTVGVYRITITDSRGCQYTNGIPIAEDQTTLVANFSQDYDCSKDKFTIYADVPMIWSQPYKYNWSTGDTTASIENITPGSKVYLTVTEANGCQKLDSFVANQVLNIGTGTAYPAFTDLVNAGLVSGYNSFYRKTLRLHGTFDFDQNPSSNSDGSIHTCDIFAMPGSKISINSNASFSSNTFKSCKDTLWKGIEISDSTKSLMFTFNTIEDAQFGLDISSSPYLVIQENEFKNNFVGVYYRPYNDVMRDRGSSYWLNIDNKFSGSYYLKAPFQGIVLDNEFALMPNFIAGYDQPFAGMILSNFKLQYHRNNSFQNLANGIMYFNMQSFNCNDCKYKNINENGNITTPVLSGLSFKLYPSGNAVYANNSMSFSKYSRYGEGGTSISSSDIDFENCDVAIHISRISHADIAAIRMRNVGKGIQSAVQALQVFDNDIQATQCAIDLSTVNYPKSFYNFSPFRPFRINNNKIKLIASNRRHNAVEISDNSMYDLKLFGSFNNNSIRTEGMVGYGLKMTNYKNRASLTTIYANNDSIYINSPKTSLGGIAYTNSNNVLESFNTVTAKDSSISTLQAPIGTYPIGTYYNASEGKYTCNRYKSSRTGAYFSDKCYNTKMSKFRFENHGNGLYLDNTSLLLSDMSNGNHWAGGWPWPSTTRAAINTQFPLKTRFEYHTSDANIFRPNPVTSGFFFPTSIHISQNQCTTNDVPSPQTHILDLISSSLQTQLARDLIAGQISYDVYDPELVYQNEGHLLEEIRPLLDTLSDTSAAYLFYMNRDTSNQVKFIEIKEKYEGLQKMTDVQADSILDFDASLDSLYQVLHSAQASIYSSIRSLWSDTSLRIAQKRLAHDSITEPIRDIQSVIDAVTEKRSKIANDTNINFHAVISEILNMNAEIVPVNKTDSLQKTFYQAYFTSFGKGVDTLSVTNYNLYQSVANQCPLICTDAVFRSRSALRRFGDTTYYDDYELCFAEGLEYKNTKNRKPTILKSNSGIIYPNPSSEKTVIQFDKIPTSPIQITITDVNGKIVFMDSKLLNSNLYFLNTKIWSNGIYLIKVRDGLEDILTSKFEIQH